MSTLHPARTITVGPIGPHEWNAAAQAYTAALPYDPISGDELRKRNEEQRAWGYHAGVLVARQAGEVIGSASYFQDPGAFHPQRFTLELAVHPDHQGHGAGAALWQALDGQLRALNAESARILAREDHPVAPGFLARRGFTGDKRYFTSALRLDTFDPRPYEALEQRLKALGVHVRSLSELRAAGTPDLTGRLHGLMSEVRQDVPRAEPATPLSRQVFEEAVLGDPGLLPGAYLVAEHGGAFIAQTALYRSEASLDLLTGLTGVTRPWRGRGVATLLKVAAARAGQALGAPLIRTDNASDNAPMLAVNDRLGFVRDPASVSHLIRFT